MIVWYAAKIVALLITAALWMGPALAQPVIDRHGIVNNGSYAAWGHINGGIPQGSLVAIFGRGLGPKALVKADKFPLDTTLGGTSVSFTGYFGKRDAWPIYVSERQVGILLPSDMPLGTLKFTVTYEGQTSAPEEADIVRRNFGAFTVGASGAGPAIVTNFISETNQPLNTVFQPARPGQVVTLWGTGLGAVAGNESAAPLPGHMAIPFHLTVGGALVFPKYVGRSGCCAGLDQIVFQVPEIVEGCYLPIQIQAGTLVRQGEPPPMEGAVNATATIAVSATDGPCSDAAGFAAAELRSLQSAGSLRTGWLWLEKSPTGTTVKAAFGKLDTASMLSRIGLFGLPAPGACIEAYTAAGGTDYPLTSPLDAGSTLSLSGQGMEFVLSSSAPGLYSATGLNLPLGAYKLSNREGGKDVGAFVADIEVKQPPAWKNMQGTPAIVPFFQWTGGDPAGLMLVHTVIRNDVDRSVILCTARASEGSFSVGSLAANAGVAAGRFGMLRIDEGFGVVSLFRFTAPGLDFGLAGTIQFQRRTATVN